MHSMRSNSMTWQSRRISCRTSGNLNSKEELLRCSKGWWSSLFRKRIQTCLPRLRILLCRQMDLLQSLWSNQVEWWHQPLRINLLHLRYQVQLLQANNPIKGKDSLILRDNRSWGNCSSKSRRNFKSLNQRSLCQQ
jgi:hypothetical protein